MGLGKTRVIVPMIILEWMSFNWLTRLTVLDSIAPEAIEYYRNVLVASLQNVKLFTLPFQRSFPLDEREAAILSNELSRCERLDGFLVVTPQHRNSLLLKQHDEDGRVVKGLKRPIRELLDESDAILHHDFQLVYALGCQTPLPSGASRWTAAGVLLGLLGKNECSTIDHILGDRKFVHKEKSSSGSFPKLRLLHQFFQAEVEHVRIAMAEGICSHLVREPSKRYQWMKHISDSGEREMLVSMLWNRKVDAIDQIAKVKRFRKHQDDILALRGFIAYGMLFHALALRHRVNYGVNHRSNRLMAVPFSASDTPKKRAEFSHPDMALLYTCLSYYHDGLSVRQFRYALDCLTSHGPSFQRTRYNEWVASVRSSAN